MYKLFETLPNANEVPSVNILKRLLPNSISTQSNEIHGLMRYLALHSLFAFTCIVCTCIYIYIDITCLYTHCGAHLVLARPGGPLRSGTPHLDPEGCGLRPAARRAPQAGSLPLLAPPSFLIRPPQLLQPDI